MGSGGIQDEQEASRKNWVPRIWGQSSGVESGNWPRQLHCSKQFSGAVEFPSEALRSGLWGRM